MSSCLPGVGLIIKLDYGTRPGCLSMCFLLPLWRIPIGIRLGHGARFAMPAWRPLCKQHLSLMYSRCKRTVLLRGTARKGVVCVLVAPRRQSSLTSAHFTRCKFGLYRPPHLRVRMFEVDPYTSIFYCLVRKHIMAWSQTLHRMFMTCIRVLVKIQPTPNGGGLDATLILVVTHASRDPWGGLL